MSFSEHCPASSVLAPYPGFPPALGMPGYKASFVQIRRKNAPRTAWAGIYDEERN